MLVLCTFYENQSENFQSFFSQISKNFFLFSTKIGNKELQFKIDLKCLQGQTSAHGGWDLGDKKPSLTPTSKRITLGHSLIVSHNCLGRPSLGCHSAIMHMSCSSFPSLFYFPICLLGLPRINTQINDLHSNPCLYIPF